MGKLHKRLQTEKNLMIKKNTFKDRRKTRQKTKTIKLKRRNTKADNNNKRGSIKED